MFCQNCGAVVEADAAYCAKCGKPVGASSSVVGTSDDAALRMVLPVGRSGWAIAAGYMGLLAFFPFLGAVFGLLGIVFGILAIRDIKKHSERHGLGRAWFGILAGALLAPLWTVFFVGLSYYK